jgi:predicted transcriptional regulator
MVDRRMNTPRRHVNDDNVVNCVYDVNAVDVALLEALLYTRQVARIRAA